MAHPAPPKKRMYHDAVLGPTVGRSGHRSVKKKRPRSVLHGGEAMAFGYRRLLDLEPFLAILDAVPKLATAVGIYCHGDMESLNSLRCREPHPAASHRPLFDRLLRAEVPLTFLPLQSCD